MIDQPSNQDRGAEQPESEDTTRRDSEAMLGGKPSRDPLVATTVDQYSIKRVIGEGGMGVVYLAQQAKPVRRRVAMKVIKAGMDSKQVIARFQAERQALALMNHPGIASVYEAGMTEDARPYFVMEYIEGTSITEACDAQHLDTTQRLELMAEVCDAVQHAHQKGVIHRDLKPGNILVARGDDDRLRPTIIDFGVAKATSQDLTEMTYMTQQGHLVGTPAYMSPEQVDLNIADIDTRSDVYALGVIMYEVITGRPPFDPRSLWDAGLEEMRRIIREEEPPRPSTWLSTTGGEEAAKIAQARQTEVASLARMLGRELEWIPLKALRKERSERYDSAKDMAEDIRRYLGGQPLEAGPESAMYRLRKAVRRNKGAFTAAAIVCLVLIAGAVVSLGFAFEAEREREAAIQARDEAETEKNRAEAVKDFVTTMLASVDPAKAGDMDKELMKLVLAKAATGVSEQFKEQPLVEAEIRSVIDGTYQALGMYDEAEPHAVAAMAIFRRVQGDEHPNTLNSISHMGRVLHSQGKYEEAMPYYVESLETRRRVLGDEHSSTLSSIGNMGSLLSDQGKYDEAMPYYVEALEIGSASCRERVSLPV
jgi:serine/threonine protein kinase